MKQPYLGKKLADIRKLKGLTQEELVAKCNVTVRTIQRIEAGEVTPRSSTLRLIVEALEYDWNNFSGDENPDSSHVDKKQVHWLERIFPFNASYFEDDTLMARDLHIAWIAGIIYFISGFPEGAMEFLMIDGDLFPSDSWY